jgi:hypothetical protein
VTIPGPELDVAVTVRAATGTAMHHVRNAFLVVAVAVAFGQVNNTHYNPLVQLSQR